MSGQPDSSDDLIAELAKLMATNAKGEAAGTQAAAKPPTAPDGKPVIRIPGMDMPPLTVTPIGTARPATPAVSPIGSEPRPLAPQAKPAGAPAIRIPGMDQAPLQPLPAASPSSGLKVDFGKPPAPAPVITPAPLNDWRGRAAQPELKVAEPRSAAEQKPLDAPRPAPEAKPVAGNGAAPASSSNPAGARPAEARNPAPVRFEPRLVNEPRMVSGQPVADPFAPPSPQSPARPDPKPAEPAGAGHAGDGRSKNESHPAPAKPHDPIGDLIAADMDVAAHAPQNPAPRPVPVAVVAPKPAIVTARPVQLNAAPAPQRPAPVTPISTRPAAFSTKQVPPESDAFFVAPVFGLGGKPDVPQGKAPPQAAKAAPPPPPAPKPAAPAARDPMDEIESLIGEAVRVEMGNERGTPAQPQRPAKPVVNPVAAQMQPRRAAIKQHEPDAAPQTAEAAILAAAAATGAEVGRLDPKVSDEPALKRKQFKPARQRGMSGGVRQYVGLAVAGTLLLASGFGLYWVLGMGRPDASTAPVLTADAAPVKQVPTAPVANAEPRSPVLDQIDGVTTPPDQEALATNAQSDADAVSSAVTAEGSESESGLANHKVRTVTVRPDGTIVASDDAVAATEPLPVERPNVPDLPGAAVQPSDLLTASADPATTAAAPDQAPITGPDPIAAVIANADGAPSADVAAVQPGAVLPPGATATPSGVVAPVPLPRPANRAAMNGQASNSVNAVVNTAQPTLNTALTAGGKPIDLLATATPPAAVSQPATASGGNAAAYVQLSSQRSEGDARASAQNMLARFGGMFGNSQLEVRRADLGAKGTYYRVMLPAVSRAQALDICGQIKSSGGDCFVP